MHPFQLLLACTVAVFLVSGCVLGGQTGSPEPAPPSNCVCREYVYSSGSYLRVHGESADADGHLVAVVDEVFGSPLGGADMVQVGDRVGGIIDRQKPCDDSYRGEDLGSAELFVLYSPGSGDTRESMLLDGVFELVLPWSDELDFGDQHVLPASNVAVLMDYTSCREHIADDPRPTRRGDTTCSLATPAPGSRGLLADVVATLVSASALLRRRRQA